MQQSTRKHRGCPFLPRKGVRLFRTAGGHLTFLITRDVSSV
jgi:hypothetical protein